MAITVKTGCPLHGVQEIPITDVHLTVFSLGPGSYYEFRCARCAELVRKPADEQIQELLRGGGVSETFHQVPAEWAEHPDEAEVPAIAWDDYLDLLLNLETNPDLFDELLHV